MAGAARSDKRLTNRLLDAALSARVEALTPAQGDPFVDVAELVPALLAAAAGLLDTYLQAAGGPGA